MRCCKDSAANLTDVSATNRQAKFDEPAQTNLHDLPIERCVR